MHLAGVLALIVVINPGPPLAVADGRRVHFQFGENAGVVMRAVCSINNRGTYQNPESTLTGQPGWRRKDAGPTWQRLYSLILDNNLCSRFALNMKERSTIVNPDSSNSRVHVVNDLKYRQTHAAHLGRTIT